jgi:hypothetical protein
MIWEEVEFVSHLYFQGCSPHLSTFRCFSVFIATRSDGNIYLEYHIWIFYEIVRPSQVGIHTRSDIYGIQQIGGSLADLANHAKPLKSAKRQGPPPCRNRLSAYMSPVPLNPF